MVVHMDGSSAGAMATAVAMLPAVRAARGVPAGSSGTLFVLGNWGAQIQIWRLVRIAGVLSASWWHW